VFFSTRSPDRPNPIGSTECSSWPSTHKDARTEPRGARRDTCPGCEARAGPGRRAVTMENRYEGPRPLPTRVPRPPAPHSRTVRGSGSGAIPGLSCSPLSWSSSVASPGRRSRAGRRGPALHPLVHRFGPGVAERAPAHVEPVGPGRCRCSQRPGRHALPPQPAVPGPDAHPREQPHHRRHLRDRGLGAWLLARRLTGDGVAAAVGGLGFGLCSFLFAAHRAPEA